MLVNNQKVTVKNIMEAGTIVGYAGRGMYIVLWDEEPTDKVFGRITQTLKAEQMHYRARLVFEDQIFPT